MLLTPLSLKQANDFVQRYHRHSLPAVGCKFAVGALKKAVLVGVAIAGRPVARLLDDGLTLEILRVCTDGTKNANSFLYGRVRAVARAMGYRRVITYTLSSESGASLRAVGATVEASVRAQGWARPSRPRKPQLVYRHPKLRWCLL